jgi:nucleotide-binding universal stress UspA family protein
LVHAWSIATATVYSAFEPVIVAESIAAVEQAARQELEAFVDELAVESPVPVTATLVHGDASSVLLDASRESDQVVVGARGSGRFERLLLGSTSTRCATHATVPTIVVRQDGDDKSPTSVRHIVVAVDGSPNSIAAVTWACSFAQPESKVDLIGVWEFSPGIFSSEYIYYPRALDEARKRFDDQIAALPAAVHRDDIEINTTFVEGIPRKQIAAHAADADLLVVGARGRGAIGSALLGSVSTWLLHHCNKPVAVVPHLDP